MNPFTCSSFNILALLAKQFNLDTFNCNFFRVKMSFVDNNVIGQFYFGLAVAGKSDARFLSISNISSSNTSLKSAKNQA